MVKHKHTNEFWWNFTVGTKKLRKTAIVFRTIYQIVKNVKNIFKNQPKISLEWWKMCLLNNFGKSAHIYLSVELQGQALGIQQKLMGAGSLSSASVRYWQVIPLKAQDLSLKSWGQIAFMCRHIKYWRVKKGNWREHTGGKKTPLNCFGMLEMLSDLKPPGTSQG